MLSAKVLCSNHPEEATLPLRCLATATPLWTCRPGTIAGAIILGQQVLFEVSSDKYLEKVLTPTLRNSLKCTYR